MALPDNHLFRTGRCTSWQAPTVLLTPPAPSGPLRPHGTGALPNGSGPPAGTDPPDGLGGTDRLPWAPVMRAGRYRATEQASAVHPALIT